MDAEFKENFLQNWAHYFPGAELPIGFYYTHSAEQKYLPESPEGHRCIIEDVANVWRGKPLCLNNDVIGCMGGKRYLGFESKLTPDFEYFLSCGIPGKVEGERYKKSPELVQELINYPPLKAPGNHIFFKRFDQMEDKDNPAVVIFLAEADVLSGLFTLANFDEPQPHGVISPFCSGCASIVDYPCRELQSAEPRCVLGMFDISARPYVPSNVLTFSVPWTKFVRMVNNMGESFLITRSWNYIRTRINNKE